MELKKLVEIKNEKKAKKPKFLRQDAHKKDKLSDNWRQPKGKDSKMRKGFRGKRRQPSMGFSSPRLVRGFNREGFKERLVNNVSDLEGIDVSKEMVIVGAIGLKKKVEVMKKCQELKVKISNVQKFLDDVKNKQQEKKKTLKEREEKKKAREDKAKKSKKEDNKEEVKEEAPKEETKKGEKSEKIKILEKKQ